MNGSIQNRRRAKSAPGLVLLAFMLGTSLLAQTGAPSTPSPEKAKAQTVELEYREVPFSFFFASPRLTPENKPFLKEPGSLGKNPLRGRLVFDNNNHSIPYLWDYKKRRLYLDLNLNQDLSDDSDGVFTPSSLHLSDYRQLFTNVHLAFPDPSGHHRALVDITFYQSSPRPYAYLECRSFWDGRISLQGKDWQLGYIESDLSGSTASSGFLLLRPWAERDQPFSLNPSSTALDAFAYCPNIFFEAQAYQVSGQFFQKDKVSKYRMIWQEQATEMGSLQLTGQFIHRLVLTRTAAKPDHEAMRVILHQPKPIVQVPTGYYREYQVHLKSSHNAANPTDIELLRLRNRKFASVDVNSTNTATLAVGGPLTNSVHIASEGRLLRFSYQLVGAGGGTYQLLTQDRATPPTFTIYKNRKKIHSGRFEFG